MRSLSKRTVAFVFAGLLAVLVVLVAATMGIGKVSLPDGATAFVDDVDDGEVTQKELDSAIQQAAVVPLADEERSQIPVAFVVLRPGETMTTEAVKRHTLAGGAAYQHPRRVEFLADLPLAGSSKVDRRALIDRAARLEADGRWSQ